MSQLQWAEKPQHWNMNDQRNEVKRDRQTKIIPTAMSRWNLILNASFLQKIASWSKHSYYLVPQNQTVRFQIADELPGRAGLLLGLFPGRGGGADLWLTFNGFECCWGTKGGWFVVVGAAAAPEGCGGGGLLIAFCRFESFNASSEIWSTGKREVGRG